MYAAAPSSLNLPRSILLPLLSFSLSSSVQSCSPRRRPAAHRSFYDLGSVPFLSSVSSERDHKSRLSEEETERGGTRDGARLLERGTSAELTVRTRLNTAKANHIQRLALCRQGFRGTKGRHGDVISSSKNPYASRVPCPAQVHVSVASRSSCSSSR